MSGRRKSERSTRRKLSSPGRPPVWQREHLCRFWLEIAAGLSSEEAAVAAGVSAPVGARWFRSSGGMPPTHLAPSAPVPKQRCLSFVEREEIALERARGTGVRAIARKLGRSPSTISREIRRNSATRSTIGPSPRNGMRIVRPNVQRSANSQYTPFCATTFRIGCPASSPHRTASPSMGPSWYGKDGAQFSGKADAGHRPGVRSRYRSA